MDEESNYSVRRFVPGACAAAVIYKKEMLDDIGFLDDDFFLNHEDTDLNMRAWLAGWRCMFVPEAVVHHKVSASIGVLSDTSVYYFARNNEWVWLKNVPLGLMIRYFPQRVLYELCSCAFFCLLAGKWRPFLKGKWDAMKGVPMILDKRRKLSKLRRLDAREIRKELLPLVPYLRRQLLMAGHGESRDIEPRE
jgi:GT2 family glycosyltransferase